jgi:hypothetical protein
LAFGVAGLVGAMMLVLLSSHNLLESLLHVSES